MTAQDDQNFYEHKERLLRYARAGTATQAQKDWLRRWGFLEKPQPPKQVEQPQPLKKQPKRAPIGKVYRYRGPMKVTPVARLQGKKSKNGKKQSVWAKSQTMRQ